VGELFDEGMKGGIFGGLREGFVDAGGFEGKEHHDEAAHEVEG